MNSLFTSFNIMTSVVLDAMNRQTERYEGTVGMQAHRKLKYRVEQVMKKLGKPVYNNAS